MRPTSNNGNQGTYTIDTGNKPQFFNPTNSIPTSIKTGNRGSSGAKGVKIKTPTQAYFSEQTNIVARSGKKGQKSPAAMGSRSPMAANYTIEGTNGLLNLKAEQVFINGAHAYKTQASVP